MHKYHFPHKDKCTVRGCGNYKHQGHFVGDKCGPCYSMSIYSQAFRNLYQNILPCHLPPTRLGESKQDPPELIRVGDEVVITCPEFVVRVGYPLSYETAKGVVEAEYGPKLQEFLDATLLYKSLTSFKLSDNWPPKGGFNYGAYKDIIRGLTKMFLQKEGYGGNERSVHTERHDGYLGKIYKVVSRRTVYTGLYDRPYAYQDRNGEWEVYSGGLRNSKAHVLLELDTFDMAISNSIRNGDFSGPWIERCNVRKV